jgi:hypothetical protein
VLPHWKRNPTLVAGVAALFIGGVAIALYIGLRAGSYDSAALMSYLPPRDAAVVYLDFRALRNSGVLELIAGKASAEEDEYRRFVEQTGFNYREDLDQVAMSSSGGVHYFVVEGRFDWDKLRSHAAASGGGCKGEVCWAKGSTPERIISFRRLGSRLMALASAGDESAVHGIAKRNVEIPFTVPPEPLWVHVPGAMLQSPGELPPGTALFARAISSAQAATFALGPKDKQYELAMNLTCKSAEDAAVLRTQLSEVTTLLQKLITREGQTPNRDDLSGVLTAGVFTRDGNHVHGRWPITPALLQSLADGS